MAVPGKLLQGVPLPNGQHLQYKLTGPSWLQTCAALLACRACPDIYKGPTLLTSLVAEMKEPAVCAKNAIGAPCAFLALRVSGQVTRARRAGVTNLVFTLAAAAYWGFVTHQLNLGWIYDSYVPLMSAAIALSFALSLGLPVILPVARGKTLAVLQRAKGAIPARWH